MNAQLVWVLISQAAQICMARWATILGAFKRRERLYSA